MKTEVRDTGGKGMVITKAIAELWDFAELDIVNMIRTGKVTVNRQTIKDQNFVLTGECKISVTNSFIRQTDTALLVII